MANSTLDVIPARPVASAHAIAPAPSALRPATSTEAPIATDRIQRSTESGTVRKKAPPWWMITTWITAVLNSTTMNRRLRRSPSRTLRLKRVERAFTSLKHDRLSSMRQATLGNAIDALAATYILLTFRHEQMFKEGQVDAELYKLFVPKYWTCHGRVMPGIFLWR